MKTSGNIALLATTAGLVTTAVAGAFDSAQTISLYWGQNSYGNSTGDFAQQSLATYCSNANIDVIPMAFVTKITTGKGGQPEVNYANSGNTCVIFSGTNLWDCPTYADDIKTCQQKYGKKILVSIGGQGYTEGGFKDRQTAINNANLLWNMFGPVNSSSKALRPFHDAVVDGFDIDVEQKNNYFRAFGLQMKTLMNADKSKQFYLTAAPQCPYPDANLDPMLNDPNGGVPFDAVFVQFYNNPGCDVRSFTTGTATQSKFNFQTWHNWATSKSANKNVKIFLGVPAGKTGGAGYMTAAQLKPIINYCKGFSSFGGVMAWDASQAYANKPFLNDVKTTLKAAKTKREGHRYLHLHGRRDSHVHQEK
ncbi:glycoside hydrolase family 18 protein [Zasmidium cellare ATCC 36951]|uniref:chitinase n=1 Tax=Zasmidium cellare ATCC 36951 TaxID=1080233 RepID=A0A6A6CEN1_ZASCE|nr:glycoside hydrolase family 18 protein [Zasmidium cellare ATCC 36951]KAF2165664.1 glycoside hydrolase family 18 protein [Zasmidium cellare ATCC 36951]